MKRKNVLKKVVTIIAVLILLCVPTVNFAHSGRTDANGGHKDNKNKSGLGSYHYHCGGYPAHLHDGGVCPYTSSGTSTSSSSSSSQSSSKAKTTSSTPSKINASSVEITTGNVEVVLGDSKKLKATVAPSNASDKTVTWTSSDKDVVMIDSEGEIKALGIGEASITAKTSNGKEDTIKVTVNPIEVSKIKINEEDVVLDVEEKIKLTTTVLPDNVTDKTLTWESSDKELVIVDSEGEIKALGVGEASIIVKTSNGKEDTIKVTVKPIKVSEIKIDESDVKLKVNETANLTVTVLPENVTDKQLEWSSENEEIVTVEDGVITAIKVGETKVFCESKDGIKADVNIVVEEAETVEVSATIDENNDEGTTISSDSDALLGAACLGAMIGVPVYIGKRKKK